MDITYGYLVITTNHYLGSQDDASTSPTRHLTQPRPCTSNEVFALPHHSSIRSCRQSSSAHLLSTCTLGYRGIQVPHPHARPHARHSQLTLAGPPHASHLRGKCLLPSDDSLPSMSRLTAVEDFTVGGLPVQWPEYP